MRIEHYNSYLKFGDLKGIRCEDNFSRNNPKHLAAIGEMLHNPTFDEFGKKHDYVAEFSYYSLPDNKPVYRLSLVPVHSKLEEVKTEPDKPEDLEKRLNIVNCYSQTEDDAYNYFTQRLKTIDLDTINKVLRGEGKYDTNPLKTKPEQPDMQSIISAANRTLETLKNRGIPFIEEE